MDESKYEEAMMIITAAGTAKSSALMAIDSAEVGDFEEAEAQIKEAREAMHGAHDSQFAMIQQEASGNPVELNLILVHAQDHLTMAIVTIDLAERMIDMYRQIKSGK